MYFEDYSVRLVLITLIYPLNVAAYMPLLGRHWSTNQIIAPTRPTVA